MNEDAKEKYQDAKHIYLTESMIAEIKRQMPIHNSRYFTDHVRKALRIGLEILKQKEAQSSYVNTTDKESAQQ